MKIFLNGKMTNAINAKVSVLDRGFNYGDGLFETMRSREGKVFMLDKHLSRLKEGAKRLGIPVKNLSNLFDVGFGGAVMKTLQANKLLKSDCRVKIILTRGEGMIGPGAAKKAAPTSVVMTGRIDVSAIERNQKRGVSAVLIKGFCPPMPGLKTLNYLPFLLARREAERQDKYEAILADGKGRLIEGSATNLFLVKNGKLVTPGLKYGALSGITRAAVLDIAAEMGVETREAAVPVAALLKADEAFLTNSIIEITPLVSVGDKKIGPGKPGPVTRALQRAFALRRAATSGPWL